MSARAQSTTDAVTAQALFTTARQLIERRRFAEACAKFEESERLEPAIGTEFHLAKCWESLGRSASAWAMYLRVVSQAKAKDQTERAQIAEARAKALEPQLSKLKIDVRDRSAGLEVLRDGAPVSRTLWGEAIPLDPGEYEISARAPGHVEFSAHARVAERGSTISIVIPELVPLPQRPSAVASSAQGATPRQSPAVVPPASDAATSPPDEARSSGLALPLALGAVGLVSVGAGVAFAIDFKNACHTRQDCQGHALSRAKTDRVLAYSGWALGGTAIAGALIVYWVTRSHPEQQAAWSITPACSPALCGASFATSFQ